MRRLTHVVGDDGLSPVSRGGRRLERSASAAVLPVLALVPVWLLALAVFWLIARIWWKVGFVWFAAGYLALGVLLFFRPVQRFVLGPLLGARRPTPDETARLETAWRSVLQRNRMRNSRYMVMVLPSDELNAFACGGHLVVVTTFALQSLPRDELVRAGMPLASSPVPRALQGQRCRERRARGC